MSVPSSSTPRRNLKRAISAANSSDTDNTPPRKKFRRESAHTVRRPDGDFEYLLRWRVCNAADLTAVMDLKTMNQREEDMIHAVRNITDNVKSSVKEDVHRDGHKILQVELYLKWLQGFDFVLTGVETMLDAKVPGTRRRVPALGRLSFSLLYNLMDCFIDEVNAHQDGWSYRYPVGPVELDPLVMSLAEESNDPSADGRSDKALKCAEGIFQRYDQVMLSAVRRYKVECNRKLMAAAIARKEENLGRACCLLCEQTGYGGTDDMGFNLLVKTRDAMMEWGKETGISERN